MSVFLCTRCDNYIDSDYVVCAEDPDVEFGLMCEDHKEECSKCEKTLGSKEGRTDPDDNLICDKCAQELAGARK
jgi:hypothetical protein